jgi:glutamyl-tRNA reductase
LVPNNKNIFVSLPKELKDFLCNLDENQDTDIMSDIDEEDDNHDMMEQILKKMFSNKKEKETVKLSLDELLDKIASNGIENLTKEEKQQLYDYSERI